MSASNIAENYQWLRSVEREARSLARIRVMTWGTARGHRRPPQARDDGDVQAPQADINSGRARLVPRAAAA